MTPPVAMTYAALDGFMTCSLQYHYAHELGLPIEQELDVSIRARRAVLAGLEYVYRDGMKADEAFLQAWGEKPLPTWEEDKMLIEHAWIAFNRGAVWQPGSASYVPETTANVNGQAISMPWMLREASGDVIWLRTGVGLSLVARNVRPILENLGGRRCNRISIHSLVTGLSEDAVPSARAATTNVYKAIAALRAGERKASRGKHCNRCAYSTICAQRH